MAEIRLYNENCISGARKHLKDSSVDLIITDPPYGIEADTFEKHYNRNERNVVEGYVEIPAEKYSEFSNSWISEAERILRPGGSIYIVSGYTNLSKVLTALSRTELKLVNHIVWKFNFGVYTRRKYVSSHYHILYLVKPGGKVTFNTYSRYGPDERDESGGSMNYRDREDVWIINKEYKPNLKKNRNELPTELLAKMMQYSSNEGDLVCDMFLGGFTTAIVAIGLNRDITGFEISPEIYSSGISKLEKHRSGFLAEKLKKPQPESHKNRGKPWSYDEIILVRERYNQLRREGKNKGQSIAELSIEFGRGRFSITNILKSSDDGKPHGDIVLKGRI
jgi:site-specific DNA-methyltransferase (adenine-specific)